MRELLEIRLKLMEGDYFFSEDGTDSNFYLNSLKRACAAQGIPYGRFTEGGLIFHDTRHTFVSGLLSGGIDLETTRELAGLSRDMILRYAHSSPAQKRKAVEVLNRKSVQPRCSLQEIFEKTRRSEIDFDEFERLVNLFFWTKTGF
ncbi:MAG: hypothetical protein ACR2N3_00515 [Pyrinomonadaceae bacterium]